MHEPLAKTLHLAVPHISMSHHGKIGIHAGIPAAIPLYARFRLEVPDIIALAGRAHKGTGAAGQAGLVHLFPPGRIEKLHGISVFEFT